MRPDRIVARARHPACRVARVRRRRETRPQLSYCREAASDMLRHACTRPVVAQTAACHCRWACAPGSVTSVAVRVGEASHPGPRDCTREISPDPRDDGGGSLVRFEVESEEALCDACNVGVPQGNAVWACAECLYTQCHECGPVRRWGQCSGCIGPPTGGYDGGGAAEDESPGMTVPTPHPERLTGPCSRSQVNAAAGAPCSVCMMH